MFTARTLLYLPGLDGTARLLHRQPDLHARYEVVCQPYPQDRPQTYDGLADLGITALEARRTAEHPRGGAGRIVRRSRSPADAGLNGPT